MTILRFFRSLPQKTSEAEVAELKQKMKHRSLDRPAGLREPHNYMRSLDGRW